jgi:hypothetical protein
MSNANRWTGLVMSGLPALFLLVDGVMKLFKPAVVVDTTVQLGFPEPSSSRSASCCSLHRALPRPAGRRCSARSC